MALTSGEPHHAFLVKHVLLVPDARLRLARSHLLLTIDLVTRSADVEARDVERSEAEEAFFFTKKLL